MEPVPLCASSLPEAAYCPTQLLCYLGPVVQSLDRLLCDWELNVVAYAMPVSLGCSRNGEGLQGTPFSLGLSLAMPAGKSLSWSPRAVEDSSGGQSQWGPNMLPVCFISSFSVRVLYSPVWPHTHYVANEELLPSGLHPVRITGIYTRDRIQASCMLNSQTLCCLNHTHPISTHTPPDFFFIRFVHFYFVHMSLCLHICLGTT